MESDISAYAHSGNWKMVAETSADEPITALFMMKHQPEKMIELEETFWAVSDPKNSRYGDHLTRDQTQKLLAPAEGNIERVTAWLLQSGVTEEAITFPNADMVELQTTVGVAGKLFDGTFNTFVHASTDTALHRVGAYTLPSHIAAVVEIVGGIVRLPEIQQPIVVKDDVDSNGVNEWPDACGKSCARKVAPGILQQRYKYSPVVTPAACSIFATAEFQGQKWSQKDMTKFATACTPNFLNATVAKEIGGPGGTGGQGVEALLDVEYASAVAGNIPMWNVYSKTYSLEDYVKTLAALADGQIPLINSVSYGNDEIQQTSTAYMYACNTQFMAIGSRGVSIMFASGDQGVCGRSGCKGKGGVFHPDFPAGSPYITSVGGTDFATKGVIGDEKAWSDGGGGFSNTFAIPSFQTEAVAAFKVAAQAAGTLPPQAKWNNTGRGYPDLAALGGEGNPYCVAKSLLFIGVAGTSASCPVAAGVFATLNDARLAKGGKPLGFLNPFIYQNGDAFNDVTLGANPPKTGFPAVKGWDAATGWGTPDASKLLTRI